MKLLTLSVVLMAVVVANSEKKKSSSQLLGADDVDKKVAEMQEAEKQAIAVPHNLREIKKLAKNDRAQIKQMQSRARTLKVEMADSKKTKSEKKELKKQYKNLKKSLHAKRNELNTLKLEKKTKKSQHMKLKPAKKMGTFKAKSTDEQDLLLMQEAKELSALTTTTGKPTEKPTATEATTTTAIIPDFNKKASRRKSQRKNEKKTNKKNRNKNNAFSKMQGDQPAAERRGHLFKKRPVCESDADCTGGAKCRVNRHGVKHCKSHHGNNKKAGKKCHSSEQCMTGLKCFVTKTTEQKSHKKHPRRGKGVCADPATTDATKGKFLPLRSESKL